MNTKYYNPLSNKDTKKEKSSTLDQIFGLFTSVPGRVSEQNIRRLALRYGFEIIADNPSKSRRRVSLGGQITLLDIYVALPSEQLDQVTFSLASETEPSDPQHSFTSQSISPSANEIILRALKQPRLDKFAKIFSFLACADRISSDSKVDCFRALDEISHTLFRIAQASPSMFSDLSTSCYGVPEFNVNNTLGLSLWYWQSHRHAYHVLEKKIHNQQARGNRNMQNTQQNSTNFTDPFTHIQINVQPVDNTSTTGIHPSGSIVANGSLTDSNVLQELMGIGNTGCPYYFQRYNMRWTIRPTGDTAVQHLEHLDPPPPSGGLENKEEEGFYNLNKNRAGSGNHSKYGVRYSNSWLSEMLLINDETGLVESWGPEPELKPVTGEFALLLDPPIFLPRHVAASLDAVVDTTADSYINSSFVSSHRRVYGPKKSRKDSTLRREGSNTAVSGTSGSNSGSIDSTKPHQGSTQGKSDQHEKNEGDKTSTIYGDGNSHGQENEVEEDVFDIDTSFSSLVPYPFVKVVEIPISHPKDLPEIIKALRKAIMIDTLCRSLNLHETTVNNGRGGSTGGPGVLANNANARGGAGEAEQEDEEEAIDSDLLLIDTILEAANSVNAKRLRVLNNIRNSLSSSAVLDDPMDEKVSGTGENNEDESSAGFMNSDLLEHEISINVSLIEENNDVHLTVSIPYLSHFSFWITPTIKPAGNIGYSLSHINFSSRLPNGTVINGSSEDLDLVGLATKLSAALEMTEDLGLVCRYLSHRLCKR